MALETVNAGCRERGEEEIKPEECLVFEDSVPGVEAGRRAGMRVVWCPHKGLLEEFKGKEEDVLAGLCGQSLVEEPETSEKSKGWPGKKGDGWAVLVDSLEGFDYEKYGIVQK